MSKNPIQMQIDYLMSLGTIMSNNPIYAKDKDDISELFTKLNLIQQSEISLEDKFKWMTQKVLDTYFDACRRLAAEVVSESLQLGFFPQNQTHFTNALKKYLTEMPPTSSYFITDDITPSTPTLRIFFLRFSGDLSPQYKSLYNATQDCVRIPSQHCGRIDLMLDQIAFIHVSKISAKEKLELIQQILLSGYWSMRKIEGENPSEVTEILRKILNKQLNIVLPVIIEPNQYEPSLQEALEIFKKPESIQFRKK